MEVSAFLFSGPPSLAHVPVVTVAVKSIRKMEGVLVWDFDGPSRMELR